MVNVWLCFFLPYYEQNTSFSRSEKKVGQVQCSSELVLLKEHVCVWSGFLGEKEQDWLEFLVWPVLSQVSYFFRLAWRPVSQSPGTRKCAHLLTICEIFCTWLFGGLSGWACVHNYLHGVHCNNFIWSKKKRLLQLTAQQKLLMCSIFFREKSLTPRVTGLII